MDGKKIHWLHREIERWEEDGIISLEQCEILKTMYQKEKSTNLLTLVFSIIGIVLVGMGTILIFATNWYRIPTLGRSLISFIPLLLGLGLGIYTWIKKYQVTVFRECSMLAISLGLYATIALISQTFHLQGDIETLFLICTILIFPGIYFFKSYCALGIYVIGLLYITSITYPMITLIGSLLILPMIYQQLKVTQYKWIINYLTLILSTLMISIMILFLTDSMETLEGFLLCGMIFLVCNQIQKRLTNQDIFTISKFCGISLITIIMFSMSYQMDASEDFTWIGLLLAIILMVLYIVLNKEKSNWRTSSTLLGISVIILIIGAQVVGIVSTVLLVVLGIYYIVEGSKNLDFPHLNYGLFVVGYIILLRFLDSELGLFMRGMIFIMLGCIFLGVNLYFIRKSKEQIR